MALPGDTEEWSMVGDTEEWPVPGDTEEWPCMETPRNGLAWRR